jgi:hypothetical protein
VGEVVLLIAAGVTVSSFFVRLCCAGWIMGWQIRDKVILEVV